MPSMAKTWAQRLKRVFNIDVEICEQCGGAVKVIACIEDKQVIDKILSHLIKKDGLPYERKQPLDAYIIVSLCRGFQQFLW